MASKAVARTKCDWAKITKHAMESDVSKLNRLKATFDSLDIKVSSLSDTLPQIEWSKYKSTADPKLVEQIEKAYSSVKVDRPKAPANRLEELNYHHKMDKKRFEKFEQYARSYMDSVDVVRTKFEKMIPVKDMTLEDWSLTFPHWSDTLDTPPTFGLCYDRAIGLTREEAAAFAQPDPIPFANKQAWKDWDEKYKKWYQ